MSRSRFPRCLIAHPSIDKEFWTPRVDRSYGVEEIKNDSRRPFADVLWLPCVRVVGGQFGDQGAKLGEMVQR